MFYIKSPWPDINHVLCSRRQCLHKERSHQLQLQIRSLASKRTTPSDRQPSPRPQSPRSNKQPTTITATVAITRITNGDLPPQLTFSWPNNSQMIQRETSWQGQRCLELAWVKDSIQTLDGVFLRWKSTMEKGTYNGKVTVNGMSEGGIYDAGKEKSYINIFKRGIEQWRNPMENTENPPKIRLQLIFNGKRAHRRIQYIWPVRRNKKLFVLLKKLPFFNNRRGASL